MADAIVVITVAAREQALTVAKVRVRAKRVTLQAVRARRTVARAAAIGVARMANACRIGGVVVRACRHAPAKVRVEQRQGATAARARAVTAETREAVRRASGLHAAHAISTGADGRRRRGPSSGAHAAALIAMAMRSADDVRADILRIDGHVDGERARDDPRHAHAI